MEKAKRNIHYSFKVSPDEDAAIRQKMKAFGVQNRSTYLRAMMLNGYLLKLDLLEILWRRYNRDDWAIDRYKKPWSEQLPENDRLIVNGTTYVHWYDCITDHIL